ncbi:hydrogenase expression/formation protein HypE [Synechocystis sp. LKSZ1]|uniref:hydrogenase expression/formation protein HypE n=1 Tax=Synechocystis sp. LKSZ1 TaxID=3144951 RepID=UPI00336BF35E
MPAAITCPLPLDCYPQVLLAHGGGGTLSQQLLEQIFWPAFGRPDGAAHDSAVFQMPSQRLAFTTDSYVVNPLIFPGGDIGSLAVYGTVNDLAMSGARPRFLSAGFILEEGLSMELLWSIVQSMQQAAQACQVQIITGDTKVVNRGKGDGLFINTAGIGQLEHDQRINPSQIQVGDQVLLSGDLGRHGMAIMAVREGFCFESPLESDSQPLADLVLELLQAGVRLHCLRDLTRGGLASALNEIAQGANLALEIEEAAIPVIPTVRGACELLGLDPLYVANEGRLVAFVPPANYDQALAILKRYHPQATLIGTVTGPATSVLGQVTLRSSLGARRILGRLSGEQLPRIC